MQSDIISVSRVSTQMMWQLCVWFFKPPIYGISKICCLLESLKSVLKHTCSRLCQEVVVTGRICTLSMRYICNEYCAEFGSGCNKKIKPSYLNDNGWQICCVGTLESGIEIVIVCLCVCLCVCVFLGDFKCVRIYKCVRLCVCVCVYVCMYLCSCVYCKIHI